MAERFAAFVGNVEAAIRRALLDLNRRLTEIESDLTAGLSTSQIADDAVTFAKFQNIATSTVVGRVLGGTGNAKALSTAELTTLVDVATAALKGAMSAADKTTFDADHAAWTSYTPTVDQGATSNIAKTINYAKYKQVGKTVTVQFDLKLTAAGTAGAAALVSLPVAAAAIAALSAGGGWVFDASTSQPYGGSWTGSSTTKVAFIGDWSTGAGWGQTPSIALAANDQLHGGFTYEAA